VITLAQKISANGRQLGLQCEERALRQTAVISSLSFKQILKFKNNDARKRN
jgi:hypothetical protein